VDSLNHKPLGYRINIFIARLCFRGIYFPQMGRFAWLKSILENRRTIFLDGLRANRNLCPWYWTLSGYVQKSACGKLPLQVTTADRQTGKEVRVTARCVTNTLIVWHDVGAAARATA
jgi:hypothetical protein